MTSPAQERLLHAAHTLFSGRSIHRVSIDDIVREAGSTKATLYRHYRSKGQCQGRCREAQRLRVRA